MNNRTDYLEAKIVSLHEAKQRIEIWKLSSKKVVFTNGCFDILHKGHVTYLAQAAQHGNRLIIGLNTDASVKRQGKSDDRPINDENARATVLAGLSCVDLIVLFDDDTPIDLIRELEPSVLAKGADYDPTETDPSSKKHIVGSDFVRASGGEVVAIPLVDGFSTTSILEKLKK
ncbi:MAG: D-glycero-beta-D-manno-heptose 1-phosphate adenylyltransferase [Crocinitomicaceae bacterium]|nr:D-glycero-beta-D-manno-heptose 1-phosphate adenylyltransferase [Flavobacteriales bacterium]NQZ35832.1 D-glycero-beta-D-manno-heptose 1-phosphate adenylyltransferase [Crocinitomicaceae bacterium]